MIKEVWHFLRYGPAVGRKQTAMGNVEFHAVGVAHYSFRTGGK